MPRVVTFLIMLVVGVVIALSRPKGFIRSIHPRPFVRQVAVLAAMRLGFRPAWALAGTSGIKGFPVLSGIEALTILVDNDQNGAGQRAAQQCSERWAQAGLEVFRAIPNHAGDDFNDVLTWRLT